ARRWGVTTSRQVSVVRKGPAGAAAIAAMMDALRASPPDALDGDRVIAVTDYAAGAGALPKANVLALELASGSRVIARPSGTEPKAKFYFDIRASVEGSEPLAAARKRALEAGERLI